MSAPVVLVAGTHDDDASAWWRQGSAFCDTLARRGYRLVDAEDPFLWSTDLNGTLWENLVGRFHTDWQAAGRALLWYSHLKAPPDAVTGKIQPVSLVCFSHGGQVALYAAKYGLVVYSLVTVGTPVRADMAPIYSEARANIWFWANLFSDRTDLWQILGSRSFRRRMRLADQNIQEPGVGHRGLLEPSLWSERRWWDLLG